MVHPTFNASPSVIIYKTRKDYSKFVPVILSSDKKKVVSYPDPADIRNQPTPTALAQGYWLDNRGINDQVAFLNITYQDYAKRTTAPTTSELLAWVIDSDPILEMYNCGATYSYTDKAKQINEVIQAGKTGSIFKKIK
ncbi:hypothetical protein [Taibaiella sp. KBW10]|uniref:hypothetical protein n=1 Tax=Taibaiella sp. KBW10 TaxID=2153357 RepID=UPI000F5B3A02|nr:hypothetical protein [Taibaiella sp. KBW10]